jgi:hypothetical protein
MLALLTGVAAWLAASPASVAIGGVQWITPLVQSIHILAVAVVMSAVLVTDLRLLGALGRDEGAERVLGRYRGWIWAGLPVLLATGAVLIVGEPQRSLLNPVFGLKMALLAGAVTLTLAISRGRAMSLSWSVRALALASLALWVGIVFAARWIAYAQG